MDRQMNLSHLSEEECQQILSVIQRDFNLRQQEQQRLEELEAEIKQEKLRSEILSKGRTFNENCCVRCFSQFYMLFNPKVQCAICKFNVCKKCSVYNNKDKNYVCSLCTKQEELEALSNKWFYSNVAGRFDRFGSANVVREIHKNKTDGVDSDSGGHLTDSSVVDVRNKRPSLSSVKSSAEMSKSLESKAFSEVDGRDSILAKLRQQLDSIEKSVQQLHQQDSRRESDHQNQFYQSSLDQNMASVKALLTSVAKQLASNLNATDSDDSDREPVNREQQEAIAKRMLHDAVNQMYTSSSLEPTNGREDPFAFIDPGSLTLDAYARRLSEAIFNRINEDLHRSDKTLEVERRADLERSKHSNSVLPRGSRFSDSETDDPRATTDSMSDGDLPERVNVWPKSLDSNPSRSESHSRMSLNSSQNEYDEPACFIESRDLTAKLAALNQSEAPSISNKSSIENEVTDDDKANDRLSRDGKRLSNRSDDGDLSDKRSNDEVDFFHRSSVNQQASIKTELPDAAVEVRTTSRLTREVSEESNETEMKSDLVDSTDPPSSVDVVREDVSEDEGTFSPRDLKYDLEEYEVTPDSISSFISRKREMFSLPGLEDDDSVSKSSDIDLDLTSGHGSDHSFSTWTFRHVPMTPHGSFRKDKRSSNTSPTIFLPQKFPPEDPIIGKTNASQISDTDSLSAIDDDSDLDEAERTRSWYAESERRAREIQEERAKRSQDSYAQTDEIQKSTRDCETEPMTDLSELNQTNNGVQTFESEISFDESSDFPDADENLKPSFKENQQNLIVSLGQSFQSKARLNGKKPIDIFWFHDTVRLDFDERCTIAHKGNVYTLEMVDVRLTDAGHYVCIGVNEHGRCSHTFCVSVIDPDTYRSPQQLPMREKRRKDSHDWQKPAATRSTITSSASGSTSTDVPSTLPPSTKPTRSTITSSASGSTSTDVPSTLPPSTKPPLPKDSSLSTGVPSLVRLSADIVCSKTGVAVQPRNGAVGAGVLDLAAIPTTKPHAQESFSSEAAEPDDDDVVFKMADEMLPLRTLVNEMLPLRTSVSSFPRTDAFVDKRLDQPSNQQPDRFNHSTGLQSLSCFDPDLLSFSNPVFEPDDGKVDLQLSFSDFEKLYESRIMTPSQLKSGHFTPEEVQRIQTVLNSPDENDNRKTENDGKTLFVEVFNGKDPNTKAKLYNRDYVVVGSDAKMSDSRRTSSSSVSSYNRQISDVKSNVVSATPSKVVDIKTPDSRLAISPSKHRHEEFFPPKSPTRNSGASGTNMAKTHAEPSGGQSGRQFSEDFSTGMSHRQDLAAADTMMQKDEAEDLAEMNLPSVRSLRKLFNAAPASDDGSNFTRIYSLTARDLPHSAIAQKAHSRSKDQRKLKPQLSHVPEPSDEDQRMRFGSSSSRDD